MSNRNEVSAKVEEAVNYVAAQFSGEVRVVPTEQGIVVEDDEGMYIIEDDEDTTEGGDEQSTTDDEEQTTEGGDDEEDTIGDGEVACQCGAVFDSKQSLYGHSSHCDDYESESIEDAEDTTEGGENEENTIEDGDEPQHPEDAENPTLENYVFHYGECQDEDCSYGANGEEAQYCASHQNGSSKKKSSSSKKTEKSYDDLTEGQKKAVNNLLEEKADEENFGVEDAVQMV